MTATAVPEVAVAYEPDSLRLLPITANLLPPEVTDARRGKKMRRVGAAIVVCGVILTTGWYYYARHQAAGAQDDLNAAQTQAIALQHQAAKYNDVVKTQSDIAAMKAELAQIMTGDLQWWQLIPALDAVAPAGVSLTTVTGMLTEGAGAPAAAAATANVLTVKDSVGTMTINGTGPDNATIARFVDALATVPGVADPFITGTQFSAGHGTTFTIQLQITTAALGGRFATTTPTASPTGSH